MGNQFTIQVIQVMELYQDNIDWRVARLMCLGITVFFVAPLQVFLRKIGYTIK